MSKLLSCVGTQSLKYSFELSLTLLQLSLPLSAAVCVKWTRGPRTTISRPVPGEKGIYEWPPNEPPMQMVATMYQKHNKFQSKLCKLTVKQQSGKDKEFKSIGQVEIDLATLCGAADTTRHLSVKLAKCSDKKAVLHFTISSHWIRQLAASEYDDTASQLSGASSLDARSESRMDDGDDPTNNQYAHHNVDVADLDSLDGFDDAKDTDDSHSHAPDDHPSDVDSARVPRGVGVSSTPGGPSPPSSTSSASESPLSQSILATAQSQLLQQNLLLGKLQADNTALTAQLTALKAAQAEHEQQQAELESLRNQVKLLQHQQQQSTIENEELHNQLKTLHDEYDDLNYKCSQLEKQISSSRSAKDQVDSDNDKHLMRISELEKANKKQQLELEKREAELSTLRVRHKELQVELENVSSRAPDSSSGDAAAAASTSNEQAGEQNQQATPAVTQAAYNALLEELNALREEKTQLETDLMSVDSELQKHKELELIALEERVEENAMWKKSIREKDAELEALKATAYEKEKESKDKARSIELLTRELRETKKVVELMTMNMEQAEAKIKKKNEEIKAHKFEIEQLKLTVGDHENKRSDPSLGDLSTSPSFVRRRLDDYDYDQLVAAYRELEQCAEHQARALAAHSANNASPLQQLINTEQLQQKEQALENERDNLKKELETAKKKIEELQQQVTTRQSKISEQQDKLSSLVRSSTASATELSELREKCSMLEKRYETINAQWEQEKKRNEAEKKAASESHERLERELSVLKERHLIFERLNDFKLSASNDLQQKLIFYEDQLELSDTQLIDLKQTLLSTNMILEEQIQTLEKQLVTIKVELANMAEERGMEVVKFNNIENKLKKCEKDKTKLSELMSRFEVELTQKKVELASALDQVSALEEDNARVKRAATATSHKH